MAEMESVRMVSDAGDDVLAAVLKGPMQIELGTFPRPTVDADSALLRVEANGICGTDVHWRAHPTDVPRVIGHEVVGRLVDVGERAAARWGVEIGDRVAVEAGIACGSCADCRSGHGQTCSAARSYGSNITTAVAPALWGGCAEYMYLAPGTLLTRLPKDIPADVAAGWFSPLANAVDWLGPLGADVQPTETVVILGPGPQGLAATLVAKERGAGTVILVGLRADTARLAAGRALGADETVLADGTESVEVAVRRLTGGAMAHRVLDVSGSTAAAAMAPLLLRRRGTVAAASPVSAPDDVPLPVSHMVWNQIRWQGVLSNRPVAAEPAAALLAANADRLGPLISHRFELAQTSAAIDAVSASDSNAIKVVVLPPGGLPIGHDA
jgi:threonine dehydrogenase-like Zn-dependent dehydrogenase